MDSIKGLTAIGIFAVIGFLLLTSLDPTLIQTLEEHPEYLYASVGAGTSMYPEIKHGDILIIQEKESPSFYIQIGDIVAFEDLTGKVIAHRVIGINGDKYLVKGDNLVEPDGFIKYDDIIGKVVKVVRRDNLIGRAYVEGKI
jgi:signal peptidase I